MSRRAKRNFHKFLTTVGLPPNYFDTDYTTTEQEATYNSFTKEEKAKFDKLYIDYLGYRMNLENGDNGMLEGRRTTSKGGKLKRRTKKRYLRHKRSSTITRYPGQ